MVTLTADQIHHGEPFYPAWFKTNRVFVVTTQDVAKDEELRFDGKPRDYKLMAGRAFKASTVLGWREANGAECMFSMIQKYNRM